MEEELGVARYLAWENTKWLETDTSFFSHKTKGVFKTVDFVLHCCHLCGVGVDLCCVTIEGALYAPYIVFCRHSFFDTLKSSVVLVEFLHQFQIELLLALKPLVNGLKPLVNGLKPLVNGLKPLVYGLEPLVNTLSKLRESNHNIIIGDLLLRHRYSISLNENTPPGRGVLSRVRLLLICSFSFFGAFLNWGCNLFKRAASFFDSSNHTF